MELHGIERALSASKRAPALPDSGSVMTPQKSTCGNFPRTAAVIFRTVSVIHFRGFREHEPREIRAEGRRREPFAFRADTADFRTSGRPGCVLLSVSAFRCSLPRIHPFAVGFWRPLKAFTNTEAFSGFRAAASPMILR